MSKRYHRKRAATPVQKPAGRDATTPAKPWWQRASTWLATAILAPVIAAISIVAITNGLNLNKNESSATSISPDLSKPPVKIDRIEIVPYDENFVAADRISLLQVRKDPDPADYGAVSTQDVTIEVSAEGNRAGLVRIVNIHVLKDCSRPLNGTFWFGGFLQGTLPAVDLAFNLDGVDPPAQEAPKFYGDPLGADYFLQHEYDLKLGEPLALALSAQTSQYYCSFRFQLDLIVNGVATTEIIDSSGKPFQVSASAQLGPSPAIADIDFPAYGALYVLSSIANPKGTAGNGTLTWVEENPGKWRVPKGY
jgi:hypothetical protein